MSPGQLPLQLHFASICLSALACGSARTPLSAAGERLLNLICPLRDLSPAFDRPSQSIQGTSGSQGFLFLLLPRPSQKKYIHFRKPNRSFHSFPPPTLRRRRRFSIFIRHLHSLIFSPFFCCPPPQSLHPSPLLSLLQAVA